MQNSRRIEAYPLERSRLYKLPTHRALAELLNCELPKLKRTVGSRQEHYWRKTEVINGKERNIVCPFGHMRKLHERLALLLNRIEQPDWLSSPRHRMTTVKSATKHLGGRRYVSLDVQKFYPSTTSEHIFRLFHYTFLMPEDVAGTLTHLVTIDGRVPFGSPLSPILCSIAHRDLFDEIDRHCRAAGAVLTVWVDDITVSAEQVSSLLLLKIKAAIKRKGLAYHKVRRRSAHKGMVMTGVHVSRRGRSPSNKSHSKMRDTLTELDATEDPNERLAIVRSLLGQNAYIAHVYSEGDPRRRRLMRQRQWLHNEMGRLERNLARCQSERANVSNPSSASRNDDNAPF